MRHARGESFVGILHLLSIWDRVDRAPLDAFDPGLFMIQVVVFDVFVESSTSVDLLAAFSRFLLLHLLPPISVLYALFVHWPLRFASGIFFLIP